MQLISIQGLDRLLYIVVEDNGQMWMGRSTLAQKDFPQAHPYTWAVVLQDWIAPKEARQ